MRRTLGGPPGEEARSPIVPSHGKGAILAAAVLTTLALGLMLFGSLSAADAKTPTAKPYQLAPYKDDLFQYANILDNQYNGDFLLVEYDRPRDLYARDVERGTKVDPKYVSLDTQAVESEQSLDAGGHTITYTSVNDQLTALYNAVHSTPPGKSLGDKVKQIQAYVAVNDKTDACIALNSFIGLVNAQKGKKLTNAQVTSFVAQANAIKTTLGC